LKKIDRDLAIPVEPDPPRPRKTLPISWTWGSYDLFKTLPEEAQARILTALTIVAEGVDLRIVRPGRTPFENAFELAVACAHDTFGVRYRLDPSTEIEVCSVNAGRVHPITLHTRRGSGNVFRDMKHRRADLKQGKALIAAEIMKVFKRDVISAKKSGISDVVLSCIQKADLQRITYYELRFVLVDLIRLESRQLDRAHNPAAGLKALRSLEIILVHGTWAKAAAWTKRGSLLRRVLEQRFPEADIREFGWGGNNTAAERFDAMFSLVGEVVAQELSLDLRQRFLICHSHGGNVALGALRAVGRVADLWAGLVMINTPFVEGSVPPHLLHSKPNTYGVSSLLLLLVAIMLYARVSWLSASLVLLAAGALAVTANMMVRRAAGTSTEPIYWRATRPARSVLTIPLLTVTCTFDEPFLTLKFLTTVQRYLQTLYYCPTSALLQLDPTGLVWFVILSSLLTWTVRPLLAIAILSFGALQALLFGQRPFLDSQQCYIVDQYPPRDFLASEFRVVRPSGWGFRHSGVYQNHDAVNAIADWIRSKIN
jgi:pimeloyl-ACP methyl ester carboxylesterase